MPLHPSGINRVNFLSHAAIDSGIAHSINLRGGFQEVYSIAERNAIPLMANNIGAEYDGFTQSDDVLSSGKRRVGMFVHVLEERKIYTLIPVGFFNNGGSLGETEWAGLPEWERAIRINPSESYSSGPAVPIDNTYTVFESPQSGAGDLVPAIAADANSCWVEVEFGGGLYNSALDSTIAMTQTIGGLPAGTTVSDLDGDTISSVLDSLLFPTAPPTFSQPFVTLTGTSGLKVVGSDNTFTLVTTANQGTLSNPSGPLAGDVTAASISGPQGITLGVSAPNGIDDLTISNYTAVLGSNAWTLTATFAQGPMPLDSTNSQYPSAQFPGTPDKTSGVSFEGVYPYFLGTSAGEDQFTERALISFGSNNVECLQNYAEDSGATGNPVLNHRILVPVARSAGAITIQVFNPNGSGAAAWPDNTAFWTEGAQVQRTVENQPVDYRVFTKDGSSGGSNNYRLVF